MQFITTKYYGPSNAHGSKIIAKASGGESVRIGYPHELNREQAHDKAAWTLCQKLGWVTYHLMRGDDNNGYVYVFDNPVNRSRKDQMEILGLPENTKQMEMIRPLKGRSL